MTITEHGIKQEPREPPTPQAGEVVIHINIKEKQTVVKMEKDRSRPSTPQPDLQDTSSTSGKHFFLVCMSATCLESLSVHSPVQY